MSAATIGFEPAPHLRTRAPTVVAVAVSLVLHAALLLVVPMWHADAPQSMQRQLVASFVPALQPEVTAPSASQRLQPVPRAKSVERKATERERIARPQRPIEPVQRMEAASQRTEPVAAVRSAEPDRAPQDADEIVAAPPSAPTVASGDVVVAPDPSTIAQYRLALNIAAKKYRDYPRYARSREWEGRATVRLDIGDDGRVRQIGVTNSSGYEVLDDTAREMLRKAQRDTPVPAGLRGKPFIVDVTVLFELKD